MTVENHELHEWELPPQTHATKMNDILLERIAELEQDRAIKHHLQVRVEKLEKCIFYGLSVTTAEELKDWIKTAEALLKDALGSAD